MKNKAKCWLNADYSSEKLCQALGASSSCWAIKIKMMMRGKLSRIWWHKKSLSNVFLKLTFVFLNIVVSSLMYSQARTEWWWCVSEWSSPAPLSILFRVSVCVLCCFWSAVRSELASSAMRRCCFITPYKWNKILLILSSYTIDYDDIFWW